MEVYNKINVKELRSSFNIKTTNVKNLNLEYVRPQRAGVILYTVVNNVIYFGMGLDSKSHDLTDFGGGVSYKNDKNVINGALREFNEETLNIFDNLKIEDIQDCSVVYDNYNLILFLHIDINPNDICKNFNKKYIDTIGISKKEPEVCCIIWLTFQEFQHAIKTTGLMFSRVQRFLSKTYNFTYLL